MNADYSRARIPISNDFIALQELLKSANTMSAEDIEHKRAQACELFRKSVGEPVVEYVQRRKFRGLAYEEAQTSWYPPNCFEITFPKEVLPQALQSGLTAYSTHIACLRIGQNAKEVFFSLLAGLTRSVDSPASVLEKALFNFVFHNTLEELKSIKSRDKLVVLYLGKYENKSRQVLGISPFSRFGEVVNIIADIYEHIGYERLAQIHQGLGTDYARKTEEEVLEVLRYCVPAKHLDINQREAK